MAVLIEAATRSMAAPPPALMADLVEEILLRFPPDDPASLVRAALVCKPWCRLVAGRGFRRRFRELHRTPPVLGLLCNSGKIQGNDDTVRFVPTASFPPTDRVLDWRAVDARHGRVLLLGMVWDDGFILNVEFMVWDPVTDEERVLPALPRCPDRCWNAAVLCAATASGTCDHLDCSRGPFLVVVVDTDASDMFVHVYSSESGAWSEQSVPKQVYDLIPEEADWLWPNVLVGNELCFMFRLPTSIVKYNLCTREVSLIDLPSISYCPDVLTTTEDGRLGFATVLNLRLYLWSREDGPADNAGWAESRVIELQSLLLVDALVTSPSAIGFAAGVGSVFVATDVGVFSIDLRSQRAIKMLDGGWDSIVPYMRFYTPVSAAFGAAWASTCEEVSLCDSSA